MTTFRQQILQNAFNAIQEGDYAYVSILPAFQAMYPTTHHVLYGHVAGVNAPALRNRRVTKLIHVRTILGFWSFLDDGLSLAGQATLSIRGSQPGTLLCLHEPIVDRPEGGTWNDTAAITSYDVPVDPTNLTLDAIIRLYGPLYNPCAAHGKDDCDDCYLEGVSIKTAECGCGADGPCEAHRVSDARRIRYVPVGGGYYTSRDRSFPPHNID